jgi:hypothetical protein
MGSRRIRAHGRGSVQADRHIVSVLQTLKDYAPRNAAYDALAMLELDRELENVRQQEVESEQAYITARERRMAIEQRLHDAVLVVKNEVRLQYGVDSPVLELFGLVRSSARRRPTRRRTTPEAAAE